MTHKDAMDRARELLQQIYPCLEGIDIDELVEETQDIANALLTVRKETKEEDVGIVEQFIAAYPTDIFREPPPRKHGKTVDGCSAAALRQVLPNVIQAIRKLGE